MAVSREISASIIFFVLYLVYFVFLSVLYYRKKISWKSRYSFIMFHVILRLGGQGTGIAFSSLSWDNFTTKLNLLIAFTVLAAEGYFSLVLCAYRFLVVWQEQRLGKSNLEPRIPKGTSFLNRWKIVRRSPIIVIHYTLIVANTLIITGGSMLSAALSKTDPNPDSIHTGKILRVVGTATFLALVQVFLVLALLSYRKAGDACLLFIIFTWPLLTVRGVYGILSIVDSDYSYYNPDVYTANGMTSTFLVAEYVMATTMEWLACGLLLATYFLPGEPADDLPDTLEDRSTQGDVHERSYELDEHKSREGELA